MIFDVEKKTKEELLQDFLGQISHNTLAGEQYAAAIMIKCANDIKSSLDGLESAIQKATDNSGKFSGRIYSLNVILAIATGVGAIATLLLVFK